MVNFPNSPTVGQTYTVGTKSWTWNGTAWNAVVSGGGSGVAQAASIAFSMTLGF
jgi:hypothetical protein